MFSEGWMGAGTLCDSDISTRCKTQRRPTTTRPRYPPRSRSLTRLALRLSSSHAPLPQAQYTLLPDAHPAPSLALRSADSTYTLPHLSTPACSLRLKFVRTRAHSRCPYPSQYNSTRERVLPSLTPSVRRSFTTFPALFPSPSPPYPASLIPAFPVSPLPPLSRLRCADPLTPARVRSVCANRCLCRADLRAASLYDYESYLQLRTSF
ncbi:hypothetical protein B0H14DRAFT_3471758 [Mycena olivaceomarginata]|nr:hypothetical protein B0H14DRAFT_3471758 [Mycena olivaceomarginata]